MEKLRAAPPKRREIWVTRDFPPGCGPLAPRIVRSNEEAVFGGFVVSSSNSDSSKDRSGRLPMGYLRAAPPKHRGVFVTREFPPGCGPLAPRIVRSNEEAVCGGVVDKSCGVVQEAGVGAVEPPIVLRHENVDASQDISPSTEKMVPLKYSSLKKISAVRDFPLSCGGNAPLISKERNEALGFDGCKNIGKEKSDAEIVPGRAVVYGLMAKKICPWRQLKVNHKLDNLSGATSKRKWKRDDFNLVPRSDSRLEKNEVENLGELHIKKNSIAVQGAYQGVDYIVESDTEDHLDHDEERDDFGLIKRQPNIDVSLPPSCPSSSGGKVVENDATVSRKKVRETLQLFQSVFRKLLQKEKGHKRIDLLAAKDLKENRKYINEGKQIIGSIPGVEVGDEFQYRVELNVIGLHRQTQGGIDYVKQGSKILATSVVSSGGYDDDMVNSDVIIYTGSGGNMMNIDKKPEDQKLERGNLALKNSIDAKIPVRVIRGVLDSSDSKARTYIYDGLYLVERYWQERGSHGKLVFKFKLVRMLGQRQLACKVYKKSETFKESAVGSMSIFHSSSPVLD